MAKYLFALFISFSALAADSVSLSQKGTVVIVTATFDGASFVSEYSKQIAALEAQRAESLKDKVSVDSKGVETKISLTPQQVLFVNTEYDNRIVDLKRQFQLQLLDQARKNIVVSIQRAAVDDSQILAEKAAAKAKIDAEYAAKEVLKPAVDVDFDKP